MFVSFSSNGSYIIVAAGAPVSLFHKIRSLGFGKINALAVGIYYSHSDHSLNAEYSAGRDKGYGDSL